MSLQKRWMVGEGSYIQGIRSGTAGEKALFMYLENRILKNLGPATREEAFEYLGFSEKTMKVSFRELIKKGIIVEAPRV